MTPSSPVDNAVDLPKFTFDSLYFCATPVELFRGEGFLAAVNQWYMPFIRSGWAIPLAFLIDVATLLLRPDTGFRNRWKETGVRGDIKALALRYYQVLQMLRRQPIFTQVAARIAEIDDLAGRQRVIMAFLRTLVTQLSAREFRNAYSFNTRRLKVLAATPTAEGLRGLVVVSGDQTIEGAFRFRDPGKIRRAHEFGPNVDLLEAICEFFEAHPLHQLIAPEDILLWEFVAKKSGGFERVDYRFLHQVIHASMLDETEECAPRPRMVHDVIPTDMYQTEGPIGGYIDIHRRPFSGGVDGILPAELALWNHRALLLNRLLNEGALHYVRENIEYVERELRMLFCFIIDGHHTLRRVPEKAHPGLGRGLTPYVRARALAAMMIEDLARFLPRHEVQVDCALYIWSAAESISARSSIDVFGWSREEASERMAYLKGLIRQVPTLFHQSAGTRDSDREAILDPDPLSFVSGRCRERRYHGRHLVFLTTARTRGDAVPSGDPGLIASDRSGDSIFVVECDVDRLTLGISLPRTVAGAGEAWSSHPGQLSEERLRRQFLDTVLLKAEGRGPKLDDPEMLGQLP